MLSPTHANTLTRVTDTSQFPSNFPFITNFYRNCIFFFSVLFHQICLLLYFSGILYPPFHLCRFISEMFFRLDFPPPIDMSFEFIGVLSIILQGYWFRALGLSKTSLDMTKSNFLIDCCHLKCLPQDLFELVVILWSTDSTFDPSSLNQLPSFPKCKCHVNTFNFKRKFLKFAQISNKQRIKYG